MKKSKEAIEMIRNRQEWQESRSSLVIGWISVVVAFLGLLSFIAAISLNNTFLFILFVVLMVSSLILFVISSAISTCGEYSERFLTECSVKLIKCKDRKSLEDLYNHIKLQAYDAKNGRIRLRYPETIRMLLRETIAQYDMLIKLQQDETQRNKRESK